VPFALRRAAGVLVREIELLCGCARPPGTGATPGRGRPPRSHDMSRAALSGLVFERGCAIRLEPGIL
jgi:hypothetical protein